MLMTNPRTPTTEGVTTRKSRCLMFNAINNMIHMIRVSMRDYKPETKKWNQLNRELEHYRVARFELLAMFEELERLEREKPPYEFIGE